MTIQTKRLKALAASALFSGMASAIGLLCYLAQVPIALSYLSDEAFGLWMTVVGIVNLLMVLDFGIGNSLQNKISESLAREDRNFTVTLARSGIVVSSLVGISIAAFCVPLILLFDWASAFKITEPELRENIRPALFLTTAVIALSMPMGMIPKIFLGTQRGWLFGFSNASISLLTLASVAAARWLRLDFVPFLAFALLPGVLARAAFLPMVLEFRCRTRWLAPRSELSGLTRLGGKFMIVQLGALVLFSAPPLIISSTLGAAALTPFNLCQRIFGIVRQAQLIVLNPLMAAFSEAKARLDSGWIRRSLVIALATSSVLCAAFCAIVNFFGPGLFTLWTGEETGIPDAKLIFWFSLWTLAICVASPISTFLNGISRMNALVVYSTITSVVALVAMIPMTRAYGATGTVIALTVSYLCIGLPSTSIDAILALRSLASPTTPPPGRQ